MTQQPVETCCPNSTLSTRCVLTGKDHFIDNSPVNKLPHILWNPPRFVTVFTTVRHLSMP